MTIDTRRIKDAFYTHHHQFKYYDNPPKTLLEALKINLPHIDPSSWQERFAWGGILLNGIETLTDITLPTPCKIDYYEPKFSIKDAEKIFPKFDPSWIIFEDSDLLVVYKPARLPSLPAIEQKRFNLRTYLEQHTKTSVHMPSRLDMSTQGIIVVSKSLQMHKPLQKIFEQRKIDKKYIFHTSENIFWRELRLTTRLGDNPSHPVLRSVVQDGGKKATTIFRNLRNDSEGSIIEASLITGRTHQIRVHASFLNAAITGDNFYNGAVSDQLRLISYKLAFTHPLTGEQIKLSVPRKFLPSWVSKLSIP